MGLDKNSEIMYEAVNQSACASNITETLDRMTRTLSLIAGHYMLCVCLIGTFGNVTVLWIFRRHPDALNSNIQLVKFLCTCDLLMALLAFPFIAVSCIYNDWIFGKIGCQMYGFFMTTTSLTCVAILTVIGLQRFLLIVVMNKTTSSKVSKPSVHKYLALLCFVFGLLFGILPFLGFGSYGLEPGFMSCAPNWWSKENNDFAYMILLLISAFFIPVCLIITSYIGILIKVRKSSGSRLVNSAHAKYQISLTITTFMLVLFYFISWGPYAIVAVWHAFGPSIRPSPWTGTFPVMLAKTSVVWDPIIYTMSCRRFRLALREDMGILKTHIQATFASKGTLPSKDDEESGPKSSMLQHASNSRYV